MTIRLAADLQTDSIVDGEGIRTVIWTQGCSHNCFMCHNPETQDFNGGDEVEIDDVIDKIKKLQGQTGITFSGGDPMFQPHACAQIAREIHKLGMNVWAYTGFTYEQVLKSKSMIEFLKQIDVLIDGKFIYELKSYDALFRGSTNQRLIDVRKSLKENKVVLYEPHNSVKKEIKKQEIFI